ncbi:hypothetical protein FACS1894105_11440 [Clostridia bacterium]|nr:hypothetical protein FACS1894105_11440 [Clostridia bacterium]
MLARNGTTSTNIAKLLTDEKTIVPSEIVGNKHTRKDEISRGWNRNAVNRILQNVAYLGHVSNGNTKKVSYRSRKSLIMPKEDRIIVKNMHTALIDQETFDIVQDMIRSRKGVRTKTYDWLLKGLINCKECGKKLSIVTQEKKTKTTFYLRCNTWAGNTYLGLCTPHSNNLEKTTTFILEQIKQRCKQFLNEEKYHELAVNSKDKILDNRFNIKGEILVLEKKIKETNGKIDQIYEDKYNGILQNDDFTRLSVKYIENRKAFQERINQLEKLEEKEEIQVDIGQLVKDFVEMKEITRTMLVSLVDKIEISQDKEITIYYRFNILNTAET